MRRTCGPASTLVGSTNGARKAVHSNLPDSSPLGKLISEGVSDLTAVTASSDETYVAKKFLKFPPAFAELQKVNITANPAAVEAYDTSLPNR
jgi:hypothetical protein